MEKKYYGDDIEFIPIDKYLPIGRSPLERKAEEMFPDYSEKAKPTPKGEESFLEEILTDKIAFLKEILGDIDRQMEGRESLRKTIQEKIEHGVAFLDTKLLEVDTWAVGKNQTIDMRRSRIEREVEALKREKREEARECWRDVALLKKERRQFYHEYRNALRRMKVLSSVEK